MAEPGTNNTGKRRHQRVSVEITGKITTDGRDYDIDMLDLSKSGAKVSLRNDSVTLSTGQSINMTLQWPLETDHSDLLVSAVIMRIENNEISVKFDHIEDNDTSD